jgi:hypothetical protein
MRPENRETLSNQRLDGVVHDRHPRQRWAARVDGELFSSDAVLNDRRLELDRSCRRGIGCCLTIRGQAGALQPGYECPSAPPHPFILTEGRVALLGP